MPITHTDGAQYWSQSEIDTMIKSRLRSQGTELAQAKKDLEDAKKRADAADGYQTRIGELEQQLAQAQGGLTRYKAATSLGINDADTIWALEQAHGRAMAGVEEGKRASFEDYLTSLKGDPSLAPSYLQHLFKGEQGASPTPAPKAGAQPQQQPPQPAPAGRQGTPPQPAPPARPAWASSTAGQLPVDPGTRTDFRARVGQAKSLDELVALQQERRRG